MDLQARYVRRGLLVALLSTLLSACGANPGSPPQPSIAASSTPAPSSAPVLTPSPAPSSSATASAEAAVLPQPLLFLREGQIMRMERDGTTVTALTEEQPGQPDILAVIGFDVSPVDGSLMYVVQGRDGNQLVRMDAQGQQRTVLLPGAPVNNPLWSSDGTQIAVQMSDPADPGNGPDGGVYLVPASGGEPKLIQRNDPDAGGKPTPEARNYIPYSWSPDGKKLLLLAYARGVEVCNAAVKDLASGRLITIQAPQGMVSGCGSGQWSPDSRSIFINMNRPGPQPPVPGLWQADPESGEITTFIEGAQGDGSQLLITNHRPFDSSGVYALIANVKTLPEPFSGVTVQYKLYESRQNDGVPLRDEEFPVVGQALWAADNSGVIVDMPQGDSGNVVTAWIPANNADPVVVLGPFMGEEKHWAAQ
jgi:dipeptidyl aminopeptidase/acylaminoacyl peptidase